MKKKLIFLIIFFLPMSTFAGECTISGKVEECKSALKSFYGGDLKIITPGTRLKSFSDFPCIQDSEEKQYYQIALDKYFSEIDEEKDEYLEKLFDNKNFYFGEEKKYDYYDGIDDIYNKRDYFLNKYYEACEDSYRETIDCLGGETSVGAAADFIDAGGGDCQNLAKTKMEIFLAIAYDGLLINGQQILIDQKREYDLAVKTKYDEVLDLFSINYGYIERLWKKWTVKTKNTLGTY